MSPTDSLFLLGESREHPMHVGGLALFTPPEGGTAAQVRALFENALAGDEVAEIFRRRARRSMTTLGQWGWDTVNDTAVDLGHHVRRDALPEPGGMGELMTLVSRLHATLLDRSRPLWEMHLIEGLADGRYAVYTKIHHALADGASAMTLLRRAMSEDPHLRGMPAPWQPPRPRPQPRPGLRPVPDPAPAEMSDSGQATPALFGMPVPGIEVAGTAVRAARGAAGEIAGHAPALAGTVDRALRGRGGPLSVTAPHTLFNVPISGARHAAARTVPLERIRLIAKHADATINDVILAASGGALRGFLHDLGALPTDPLIAMVPVSLRGPDTTRAGGESGTDAEAGGNRVGVLMCNLATHLPDPAHRLDTVRTCMREGKQALRAMSPVQVLAMSALGAAPLAAEMLLGRRGPWRPPFNLVISNVPGPRAPLYWNGARLDALHPLSIPTDGQALNITATSSDDQLSFGLTACRRTVPHLDPLLDHLGTELDALETAVGL